MATTGQDVDSCADAADGEQSETSPPSARLRHRKLPDARLLPRWNNGEIRQLLSASEDSGEEAAQQSDNFYDSQTDHGDSDGAQVVFRGRTRFAQRKPLKRRVEGLVQELRTRQQVFQSRQRNLAQRVNRKLRSQWDAQQERLAHRGRQMASKLQSGRSRAWRHKWIYVLVHADMIATAYWLGAWPETFYMYYSVQVIFTMCCKVFDYVVKKQHYFLLDLCYYANMCMLALLWIFPKSGALMNATEGVCGLLAISGVAFRNSCVPHDFIRISHAYVHYPAVVAMQTIKRHCTGDLCVAVRHSATYRWHMCFFQAWAMYLSWALFYYSVIFGFAKKRIEKKQRETLYQYFAVSLGWREKLPKPLRPYSQLIFMVGHQTLFFIGVWWMFLPPLIQVVGTILFMGSFFHNGGRYYVDHFWKSYERNTLLYLDAAVTAMAEVTEQDAADLDGASVSPSNPVTRQSSLEQ